MRSGHRFEEVIHGQQRREMTSVAVANVEEAVGTLREDIPRTELLCLNFEAALHARLYSLETRRR